MDEDEYVETSDAEEREEQALQNHCRKHETDLYLRDDTNSPRKRVKLNHEFNQNDVGVQAVLPNLSSSSPSRRSSNSPELEASISSPSSPRAESTPMSSSFVNTPLKPTRKSASLTKIFNTYSQDPLLLSAQAGGIATEPEQPEPPEVSSSPSTTLYLDEDAPLPGEHHPASHSPVTPRSRSQSMDPLSLFHVSTPNLKPLLSLFSSPVDPTRSEGDAAFDHSPSPPTSPLTPPPLSQTYAGDTVDTSHPEDEPTPDPLPRPISPRDIEHDVSTNNRSITLADFDQNISRYPLRPRGPNQLKPYTVEKYQYRKALSSNREAMVKFRSPTRGGNQHYREELDESQELWEPDEAGEGGSGRDEGEQRDPDSRVSPDHRSTPHRQPDVAQYPELLQDLPSTDEEEARERRQFSKEHRHAERERRARDAKGKVKTKPRAKPFPLHRDLIGVASEPSKGAAHASTSMSPAGDSSTPHSPPAQSHRLSSPASQSERRAATPIFSPISTSFQEYHSDTPHPDPHSSPHKNVDDLDADTRSPPYDDVFNETHRDSGHDPDGDSSGTSSESDVITRKRLKALNRMVPAFMINQLVKGHKSPPKPRNQRHRSITVTSGSDGETTKLPPGQTRTRLAEVPRDIRDIKGDTESSDDDRSSVADSIPDIPSWAQNWDSDDPPQRGYRRDVVHIDITDSSDDEGVDDQQIQAFLGEDVDNRNVVLGGRFREESLIDWMLSRTRTVGVKRKPKTKRSKGTGHRRVASSSKFKIDGVTGGARGFGRKRQTLLDFQPQPSSSGRRNGYRSSHSPSRLYTSDVDDAIQDRHHVTHIPVSGNDPKKKARKQQERERRARAKGHGVYTFASNNTHVVTGRRETAMVTVDVEDEGFHQALVPLSQDWATPFRPPPPTKIPLKSRGLSSTHVAEGIVTDNDPSPKKKSPRDRRDIRGDFDIPILHSGISFGPNTYIGKGWLHGLIEATSSNTAPPMPTTSTLRGIELDPSMTVEKFSQSLNLIFDGLFDMATSLPGLDTADEVQEWSIQKHIAGQLLTWFLATGSESDVNFLRKEVQQQTLNSVSRFRDLQLESDSTDTFTFSACWFLVEISARLGVPVPAASTPALTGSISLLVRSLLDYGLALALAPILEGTPLDGTTTAQVTAELWVCFFHLLDARRDTSATAKKQIHPFWLAVKEALESGSLLKSCLEASEETWRTIFSFCALTQFSVHGMSTSTSRLPACWELVVFALKKIRLTADATADRALSRASLDKRDEYIGLVTLRCFHLWNRWHWQLEDASILFNQLVEIFRSRKFAGLRHEVPDYPAFMLSGDWSLLSAYDHGDTAFVLFLKLLVKAAAPDNTDPNRALSPRAKKLLSLAIPVGSLPFSKKNPTAVQDLSMLYNRLSAVAIGIYLDPSHHVPRVSHARAYVDFTDADDTTRVAVSRGMMNLAILMNSADIPLDGIVSWIEAIAAVLVNEYKGLNLQQSTEITLPVLRGRLFLSVQMLVGSVRRIIEAYKFKSEYPEPTLLASLSQVFLNQPLTSVYRTADEIQQLLTVFLEARKLTLPEPERPRIVPIAQESQESQDEYGMLEIDYDDPALLAALGADIQPASYKAKDEIFKTVIDKTRLVWLSWRHLSKSVQDPPIATPVGEIHDQFDKWLYCWLGCADVLIRAGGKSWHHFLDLTKSWAEIPGSRRHRIELSLMFRIMKLDPMTYKELRDRYFEAFISALVTLNPTLECEYVTLFLSIDGTRHPLLVNLDYDPENYAVSRADYAEKRRSILQILMINLSSRLQEEAGGDRSMAEDNEKYVGFFITMFRTMEIIFSELDVGSDGRREYMAWCRSVFQMIYDHQVLRSHPRLLFWMTWERSLA